MFVHLIFLNSLPRWTLALSIYPVAQTRVLGISLDLFLSFTLQVQSFNVSYEEYHFNIFWIILYLPLLPEFGKSY